MLRQLVTDYLKTRRALGFELEAPERMLYDFAAFAKERRETHVLAATAVEWAAEGSTAGVRHHRLQRLVLFARHVRAEDPRHEVPSSHVFPRVPRQIVPHIYTPDEARRLKEKLAGAQAKVACVISRASFFLFVSFSMFGSSWQKEQSTPKSLLIDFIVFLSSSLEMVLGRICRSFQPPPPAGAGPGLAAAAGAAACAGAAAGGAAWGSAKTAWVKKGSEVSAAKSQPKTLGLDVNIGSRSPRNILLQRP